MAALEQSSGARGAGPEGDWHAEQDRRIDDNIAITDQSMADPSAFWRTLVWGGLETFYNGHLVNVHALKRADERFRLLDLGCGTGDTLREIAPAFPNAELIGIDANKQSLERARAIATPDNVTYVEGMFEDAASLGEFDVVVCSEVFEHVSDPAGLLRVAADVLKPGGHISFSTPSGWMWRRPGISTAWMAANSPAEPRLRDIRSPGALAERVRNASSFYRRIRLHPEDNWDEALPHHPAVAPKVARRMLSEVGFDTILRTGSVWLLDERFSVIRRGLKALERRNAPKAAQQVYYSITLLESLLNIVPPLRVFESRMILLARKRA